MTKGLFKMESHRQIQDWPVKGIQSHPQNRPVRKNAKFDELRDSIRSIGIQQPLIVRSIPGRQEMVECLSGHRRLAAAADAGLETVPVDHRGQISDAEAFDVMAISNLHEDLSPLEEGQRAALWLDHYDQDAQAVASKLGKTPRFIVEHAQIYRNLVADWHKALESAETKYGSSLAEQVDRWTASHWAVIARLPQRMQLEQLKRFLSGSYCSFDRWSVKELETRIGLEMLSLAKAPFDVATCKDCVNRTGAQPVFLWADDVEGAVGDKEKCLDKKCYERKCQKAEKAQFVARRSSLNYPDAVPLSTLVEPKDWYKGDGYRKQLSALKKVHGKDLVTVDAVEVVKKGKDWDVHPEKRPKDVRPAIVVAGKGKGTVAWIKPKPKQSRDASQDNQQTQRDWEAKRKLWKAKCTRLYAAILARKLNVYQGLAVAILSGMPFRSQPKDLALLSKHAGDFDTLEDVCLALIWDRTKAEFEKRSKDAYLEEYDWDQLVPVAQFLGIDLKKIAAEAKQAVEPNKEKAVKETKRKKRGAEKTAKEVPPMTPADAGVAGTPGICRLCGCTDEDCSECVEETGEPCTWVEPDLCSRCAAKQPEKAGKSKSKKTASNQASAAFKRSQ